MVKQCTRLFNMIDYISLRSDTALFEMYTICDIPPAVKPYAHIFTHHITDIRVNETAQLFHMNRSQIKSFSSAADPAPSLSYCPPLQATCWP